MLLKLFIRTFLTAFGRLNTLKICLLTTEIPVETLTAKNHCTRRILRLGLVDSYIMASSGGSQVIDIPVSWFDYLILYFQFASGDVDQMISCGALYLLRSRKAKSIELHLPFYY